MYTLTVSFKKTTWRQLFHAFLTWKRPFLCRMLGHLYHKWHYRGTYESFWNTCTRCPATRTGDRELTPWEKKMSRLEYDLREPERM